MDKVAPADVEVEAKRDGELDETAFKLKTSSAKQKLVIRCLSLAVLFDMAGGFLLQAAFPNMSSTVLAKDGAVKAHQDAFPDPGLNYVLSVAMYGAAPLFGQAVSNLIFPVLSDKIGRKPVIVLFQAASVVGHTAIYIFNTAIGNYWLFIVMQFYLGFFGGTTIIAITYVNDMFPDPIDNKKKMDGVNSIMGAASMAVSFGSLAGLILVEVTDRLFYGSLLGIALSTVGLGLSIYIPGQMKSLAQIKATLLEKKEVSPPTPAVARNTLLLIIVAMVLDVVGSAGLNTIRQSGPSLYGQDYLDIASTINATLIFSMVVGVPIGIALQSAPGKGPVHCCVLGNLAVAAWQFVFMGSVDGEYNKDAPAPLDIMQIMGTQTFNMTWFVVFTYASALVNVWSTLTNDTLIQGVAPPDKRGYWGGIARLVQNLANAAGSLAWPAILGDGTNRLPMMLILCGSISVLAALAYTPQYQYFPMPSKEKDLSPEWIEEHVNCSLEEWNSYNYCQQQEVLRLRVTKGMPIASYKREWGIFDIEVKDPASVPAWADPKEVSKILKFVQQMMIKIASDREQMSGMAKAMEEIKKSGDTGARDKAAVDMGKWLAAYLDYRGYNDWCDSPDLYKIMIANAFPSYMPSVMDVNVFEKENVEVADIEASLIGVMKVIDRHTDMSQSQERDKQYQSFFQVLKNPGSLMRVAMKA